MLGHFKPTLDFKQWKRNSLLTARHNIPFFLFQLPTIIFRSALRLTYGNPIQVPNKPTNLSLEPIKSFKSKLYLDPKELSGRSYFCTYPRLFPKKRIGYACCSLTGNKSYSAVIKRTNTM